MTHDFADVAFDVLIVGGGLVGASLACALDGRGLRIGLVEAEPAAALAAPPPTFDQRNLALAAASVEILERLGVWPAVRGGGAPIRHIHVSRAGDFGAVRLDAETYGRADFGRVVVAHDLGIALETRLGQLRDVVRLRPARVTAVHAPADGCRTVELETPEGPRRIATRLVVGADGTRSGVREALGIGVERHDYRQTLIVCSAAAERAPDGRAWERFGPQGPTALLPRPDGRYGAVCGVPADEAARMLALDDADYLDVLQSRAGWRAGRLTAVGSRVGYPLQRCVAQALHAPRAVLVGNAAQTIHPIGAQGFNLGLRDAVALAARLAGGSDPGDAALLATYAAERAGDRSRTLAFSDGLARITSNPSRLLGLLRGLGMLAVDLLPPLRDPLVAGAMGYRPTGEPG
ncbi:2-octaprenyl-6-methoxyphenyl hydroxylase [Coralloluteibacterium thermophilus]|uniref:2-octaprenyl-6-methoxyphenyl hydroxylase n=1 Tax=Coralloluteibacterium thermophilum TaxID=2707049 RepID=A0ABV9NNC6_9GAMM